MKNLSLKQRFALSGSYLIKTVLSLLVFIQLTSSISAQEKLSIRIGVYDNAPKIFIDQGGEAIGFWPDLIRVLAEEEGWTIEWVVGTWEESLNRLRNNTIDIMPDVGWSAERAKKYDFASEVVLVSWSRVYVPSTSKINTILDLRGKRIGGLRGSINIEGPEGLRTLIQNFDLRTDIVEMESYHAVFQALEDLEIDAGVTNKDFGSAFASKYSVRQTPILLQPTHLLFAFPKEGALTRALIQTIDTKMAALKRDEHSSYYELMEYWLGVKPESPGLPLWVRWVVFVIAIALIIAILFTVFLRRKVNQGTEVLFEQNKRLIAEIVGREQAEKELLQLSTAVEHSPASVVITDTEGTIQYVNPKFTSLTGYSFEEAIGKNPNVLKSGEQTDSFYKDLWETIGTGKTWTGEFHNKTKSGELYWELAQISPILGKNGIISHYLAIKEDISERRLAEEALRESEDRFRTFTDQAIEGITVTDLEGKYTYVNPAFCKMSGYAYEELMQMSVSQMLAEEILPGKSFLNNKDKLEGVSRKILLKRKDGSHYLTEIAGKVITLQDEKMVMGTIRDISEREAAEELNRDLAHIIDNALNEIYIFDRKTYKFSYTNKGAQKNLGYSQNELLKLTPIDIKPQINKKSFKEIVKPLDKGNKKNVQFETIHQRKDGSEYSVAVYLQQASYLGQKSYLAIISDITELKLAKGATKEVEERYKIMFENAIDAIIISDENGLLIEANPSAAKLLGYSKRENMIGVKASDLYVDPEARVPLINEILKNGFVDSYELSLKKRDGVVVDVLDSAVGHFNEQGTLVRIEGIIKDVTEEKKNQKALKQAEKKYRSLFENMHDGFALHEIVVNKENAPIDYVFLEVNDAFEKQTGLKRGEVFGKKVTEVIPTIKNDAVDWIRIYGKVALSGKGIRFEQYSKSLNKWYSVIAFCPQANYFATLFTDITIEKEAAVEREALESQLRQSQKLEAVGRMAGGIAHDFNNILQVQLLYSGIVKEQLPDDEKLHANFQQILDSGSRASELVKQILTFSRKGDADLQPTKLQYLIKDAIKLVRASTPATIEIDAQIDTDCEPVLCDANQFHQVLINLCNNAVHAMEQNGGSLSIIYQVSDAEIELSEGKTISNENGIVELVISDTGKGMDKHTLEQIYDPFFTTKEVGKGTGLGLSIVHGIVSDIQGEVRVESEPDKGSTFRVLMPISREEHQEEMVEAVPEKVKPGIRILFVDDDEMIARAGKQILESRGNIVTTMGNGSDALEHFRKDPQAYDLIITDLTMPKMTGLELSQEVRKLSKEVPILLTSGNLDLGLQTEFESLGFSGFIRKPWTIKQMLLMIGSVLAKD